MNCFISYTQADLAWAEWIAWQLEESGLQTILQAWDFHAGSNFILEMDSAAKRAQRTIVVLSTSYVNAAYTHPEWASALARDPTGEKRVLLPVRVQECTLTGLLAQVVYVDLVGLTEIEAKRMLLSQVQGNAASRSQHRGFPGDRPVRPPKRRPIRRRMFPPPSRRRTLRFAVPLRSLTARPRSSERRNRIYFLMSVRWRKSRPARRREGGDNGGPVHGTRRRIRWNSTLNLCCFLVRRWLAFLERLPKAC